MDEPTFQTETAQEMYHFIKNCKADHLTIADVNQMKVGDEINVVIWDRNFEEYWIWEHAENEKPCKPEMFFKENHHRLTYLGDMTWNIHFPFGETVKHPIHLDVSDLETNWTWCAIEKDGKIHITSEMVNTGQTIPTSWNARHIHWTEFPDTTRVGWRGPIMLWEKLAKGTWVYYIRELALS